MGGSACGGGVHVHLPTCQLRETTYTIVKAAPLLKNRQETQLFFIMSQHRQPLLLKIPAFQRNLWRTDKVLECVSYHLRLHLRSQLHKKLLLQ